jgi:TetR/AcrR family transcriptional regulator, cholesterol catabolism regulator
MESTDIADAKTRLLDAADRLFMERGYKAVTLRDIADAVGIKHASIYHHVPGGKQQLFADVMRRTLQTHREGIHAALSSHPTLKASLYEVADWVLKHPPMDLMRMMMSDLPGLQPADQAQLSQMTSDSLLKPLEAALVAARDRGEIATDDAASVGAAVLTILESMHAIPDYAFIDPRSKWFGRNRHDVARFLIDTLFEGLSPRSLQK